MSEEHKPGVVIAGGGTAGWMAAAALARFAGATHTVTLVESEAIGTVGVGEATIPQIHNFNHALGLDEGAFLAATKATFKLGIEFAGWSGADSAYMHAFGLVGRGHGVLPFQHYWLRGGGVGGAAPLSAYSRNEQAARAGRFPPAGAPQLPYAYHFDAALYAAHLRSYAEARGVRRVEGRIAAVERDGEGGDIAALTLEGGARIAGDFFIDCTGFRALLLGAALGVDFEDWSALLPCDTALAVASAPLADLPPFTRATARKAGWQWRIPLQHRTGNGHVYCSAYMGEDEASAILLAGIDGEVDGDPRPIRFTTGKRREHWHRNCLALGLAAGFMEPLESTSIHLVQSAIARFLPVLPGPARSAAARDRFNRDAQAEWLAIRDFLVLHYWANRRDGEPFWDAMRAVTLPQSLMDRIALWRETAAIHRTAEELFAEVGWLQVLVGQGVLPAAYNPLAGALDEGALSVHLAQARAAASQGIGSYPTHREAIAARSRPVHPTRNGVAA